MCSGSTAFALEKMFVRSGCTAKIAVHLDERPTGFPEPSGRQEKDYKTHRKIDFDAGRKMAGRCLETLGCPDHAIGRGPHREPIWPDGITGSITHTDGLVIAVACEVPAMASLGVGIDAERLGSVEEDVYETVFTKKERLFLARVNAADRTLWATCTFSAKEAFFKAQFPLTRGFVDFPDVEIAFDTEIAETGTLQLKHDIAVLKPYRIVVSYRQLRDFVVTTAVVLKSTD